MEDSLKALVEASEGRGIAAAAREKQAREDRTDESAQNARMLETLSIMRASVKAGSEPGRRSLSGLTGGGGAKMLALSRAGGFPGGGVLCRAAGYALAVAEHNAAMGKIVAAPTAGACGILPAALFSAQEEDGFTDQELADALFVAAAVGRVIARRASLSGAEGGCQAECGSAAAMAAAALTFLYGGTPAQSADACAFALMNVMGLVCDPVRGLVEVPCVYRNAGGVAGAFVAAQLTLSGIPCPLPPDEIIDAMRAVGDSMPSTLRETGEGGCAGCPSACG